MNYYVRPSKREDCYNLAKSMRKDDVQELFASTGSNPAQALIVAYLSSHRHCYSLILEDEVVGMFGINRINEKVGIPWLLGSDKLTKYRVEFHKLAYKYLNTFMDEYNVLFNYVDKRNWQAVRWLKVLGFTFTKLIDEYGYEKKPFYEFVKANTCAIQQEA